MHPFVPGKGSQIFWQIMNKEKNAFPFSSILWHWFYGEWSRSERVAASRKGGWK